MSVFNAYLQLSAKVDAQVLTDELLSRRCSYRIGGPAALFIIVNSYQGLRQVLEILAKEQVPWHLLGRGSNILASDKGFNGAIIKLGGDFTKLSLAAPGEIIAGAGAELSQLLKLAQKEGLAGLDCLVGIPGTVGGALAMNAGSRHHWISAAVSSMVCLHPEEGLKRYAAHDLDWGYRRVELDPAEIILECSLQLVPSSKEEVARAFDRRLKNKQRLEPIGKLSCGSVFLNPGTLNAGALIEQAGLKGYRQGGAHISENHANFFINDGTASASDIIGLINMAYHEVKRRHNIDLVPAVKLLGFGD